MCCAARRSASGVGAFSCRLQLLATPAYANLIISVYIVLMSFITDRIRQSKGFNYKGQLITSYQPSKTYLIMACPTLEYFPHGTANLLRAQSVSPKKYKHCWPPIYRTPKRLTPHAIPRLTNLGLSNKRAPAAKAPRAKSLAAKNEAVFLGSQMIS